jgi:hypothetical protein
MLITARAISHSVQFVERFYEEYEDLGDKDEACIRSMAELLLPGTLGIVTDCIGLLTIALATIPIMYKLGILCAFWAASIIVTEMLLNRLLILYLPAPRERRHFVLPLAARALSAAARLVGRAPARSGSSRSSPPSRPSAPCSRATCRSASSARVRRSSTPTPTSTSPRARSARASSAWTICSWSRTRTFRVGSTPPIRSS